jgi:hypothetical protein
MQTLHVAQSLHQGEISMAFANMVRYCKKIQLIRLFSHICNLLESSNRCTIYVNTNSGDMLIHCKLDMLS